jgi:hypothetical protein
MTLASRATTREPTGVRVPELSWRRITQCRRARPAVSRSANPPGRRCHRAAGGGSRAFPRAVLAATWPPAVRGRPRNRPRPRNRRGGVEVSRPQPAGTDSPRARLAVGGHGPCPARLRQADRAPIGATRSTEPDLDARRTFPAIFI